MKLSFGQQPFDAVICLNGDVPARSVFEELANRPLIAADGAANTLFDQGVGPEFVVGDLDSIDEKTFESLKATTEFVRDHDQDSTDFEKAIRFAESQLWRRLLVVGIHGGDLEHTLNNWSVLMRHGRELDLTALDRSRYAIPIFDSFSFGSTANEMISLIPQPLANLTTRGLQWELKNEPLELGVREGARNRSVNEEGIHIEMHSGSLLFFCDARLPVSPELQD